MTSATDRLYHLGPHRLWCGDAADFRRTMPDRRVPAEVTTLVWDPDWDDVPAAPWATTLVAGVGLDVLAFADGRRLGDVVTRFGAPTWLFTWDTGAPWTTGPRRPLQRSKLCAWYGDLDTYDRDATTWGEPADAKNNPTTLFEPHPEGRRLADVYSVSLRWFLAGTGHSHAKPPGWLTCLVGNTNRGDVLDPFAGSGTSMVAAHRLGRRAYMVERDPDHCDLIRARWHALATLDGIDPGPDALDPADRFPTLDLRVGPDVGTTHRTGRPRRPKVGRVDDSLFGT